ncbi:hypothetical protein Lser_V15G42971 [Lactuca serriola]|uniref:RING-type domain-containing protein n=1 Tax=Lactuca saligna TaxID=75948 RepID=A0AA36EN33_LACSI|nr:unnamed protein product [Lactuca saligna]CAI9301709.1 unnamed protein product [Lactuca saligna]
MVDWSVIYSYCGLVFISSVTLLFCVYLIKYCYQRWRDLVEDEDIESGTIRPSQLPINTFVINHLVVALQQTNLAELNSDLGEILQEQIYTSSTCKNDDCVICLEEFKKKEKIRVLVSCQHPFHGHCIITWLFVKRSCPICREPIRS